MGYAAPVAEAKISDVARMAGVSASTVLNVLDGQTGRMRPEVVQRIKKAIMVLEYRPPKKSPDKAAPKTRAPLLGLLVPSIANPFFAILVSEIERAAHAYGYRVLFGNTYRDPKKERELLEDFFAHG